MNKEQQYRTGIFPMPDPVPQWVRDAVSQIAVEHDEHADVLQAQRECMRTICSLNADVAAALQVLGRPGGDVGLRALTQSLADADPLQAAQYWEAMWTVQHARNLEDDYRKRLAGHANTLERHQRYRDRGWPYDWHPDFCRLWRQAGGNALTASAWARRGWTPVEALTAPVSQGGRALTLDMRVREFNPPSRPGEVNGRASSATSISTSRITLRGIK